MLVSVAVSVVVVVVVVVLLFVKWKPIRKKWCVMLYFDGRDGDPTGTYLEAKLQQVLTGLESLPCNSKNSEEAEPTWAEVHIVYRAIWDSEATTPIAKVVHWRPFAPKTDYFAGEPPITDDLSKDLHLFFQWAYDNCPADRYAVYFWGHSFGPGGLFNPSEPPIVDPPPGSQPVWTGIDQVALKDALDEVVAFRIRDDHGLQAEVRTYSDSQSGGSQAAAPAASGAPSSLAVETPAPKVEIVLFQDCWMSSLETAYSLQDSARYVVASQSLVPIGLDSKGKPNPSATWPYKLMIDVLMTRADYAPGVLDVLQQYFDSSPDNRFPNPTVPFTLLDLGANKGHVSATLTGPYLELVTALSPLGKTARQNLIQFAGSAAGRLSLFVQGTLRAGDVALVDVITLCNYLQNQTTVGTPAERQAIGLAAGKVAAALTGSASSLPLVRSVFESADSGQQLGFTGVSVLYKPNQFPSGDPTLLWLVHYDYYASLPFAQETKQSGSCWPVYAFEQLGFNPTC